MSAFTSDTTEHKLKEYKDDSPEEETVIPPLSRRGRQTIPRLLPILDHTEPPIYIPGYSSAPRADDINMSTAENYLLRSRLIPKFLGYLQRDFDAADLSYISGAGGAPELLDGLADFFNTHFEPKVEVEPSQIATAPGASHLLQSVMFHICNEGEGVLIQTPYWPGFDGALTLRDGLVAVPVDVPFCGEDADPFGPQIVAKYEEAFKNSGETITAMIICNPQNPVGGYYPEETLLALLFFAKEHNLHVVVDELYALSVFKPDIDKRFCSVLSIDLKPLSMDRARLHFVYSFSKDLNSSGIRLGVFVNQANPNLLKSVAAYQNSKVSSFTSVAATGLLRDKECLADILEANPELLFRNYRDIKSFFDHHKIRYIHATAGVYVLANLLAKTGRPMTFNEETKLNDEFRENHVWLNKGYNFHCTEPGWFRMIFAVPRDKLHIGLKRVEKTLGLHGWVPPLD